MVVKDIARPSILKTYETERRGVAQELIAFDQEYSRLWSSRPKKAITDQDGISIADFERAFLQQQLFSSGFGVHYGPGPLTAHDSSNGRIAVCPAPEAESATGEGEGVASSHQRLATRTILGKRFPSFRVINHCDARSWHLGERIKSDGLFHIVLFAGGVSQPKQMERVRCFAREMTERAATIPLHRGRVLFESRHCPSSQDRGGVARLLTVHSAPRRCVEIHAFPPLLLPYDEELGYDYDCIFVDEESYYQGHGHAYDGYGVDPTRGCVVVMRPDQHVAWIGELEDVPGLETYFMGFLVQPSDPNCG